MPATTVWQQHHYRRHPRGDPRSAGCRRALMRARPHALVRSLSHSITHCPPGPWLWPPCQPSAPRGEPALSGTAWPRAPRTFPTTFPRAGRPPCPMHKCCGGLGRATRAQHTQKPTARKFGEHGFNHVGGMKDEQLRGTTPATEEGHSPEPDHGVALLPSPCVGVALLLLVEGPLLGLAQVTSGRMPRLRQLVRVGERLRNCEQRTAAATSGASATNQAFAMQRKKTGSNSAARQDQSATMPTNSALRYELTMPLLLIGVVPDGLPDGVEDAVDEGAHREPLAEVCRTRSTSTAPFTRPPGKALRTRTHGRKTHTFQPADTRVLRVHACTGIAILEYTYVYTVYVLEYYRGRGLPAWQCRAIATPAHEEHCMLYVCMSVRNLFKVGRKCAIR